MFHKWARAIVARFPEISREHRRLLEEKNNLAQELSARSEDLAAIQKAYEQSRDEVMRLQDRLEDSMRDRTELWKLTRECLEGERTAYQMHINVQWQQRGGGVPYPDQPHIPPADQELPNSAGRERVLASAVTHRKAQDYMRRIIKQ